MCEDKINVVANHGTKRLLGFQQCRQDSLSPSIVIFLQFSGLMCVHITGFSLKYFVHGIVLARYGKLFMLPLLVWSKSDDYCEVLIAIFIFLSQMQVIRVTTEFSSVAVATVLIIISELMFWTLRNTM